MVAGGWISVIGIIIIIIIVVVVIIAIIAAGGVFFPAIFYHPGINGDYHIGGSAELLGGTLLTEQGHFYVLAVVFYRLDGPGKIIIACHEDGYVIIVFIAVGYHIRGQLDVRAFFIRGDAGPVGIDQPSQAQFSVGDSVNPGKESLLLLV
jgi:hypothetical protein